MFYTTAQCAYCREETAHRLRDEHPEWFDCDNEEFYEKILNFVDENTTKKFCLIAESDFDKIEDVNEAYCAKHLRTIAKEMDDEDLDRVFTYSELFGPFACEIEGCKETECYTIVLTEEEMKQVPKNVDRHEQAAWVIGVKIGCAMCDDHAKEKVGR